MSKIVKIIKKKNELFNLSINNALKSTIYRASYYVNLVLIIINLEYLLK